MISFPCRWSRQRGSVGEGCGSVEMYPPMKIRPVCTTQLFIKQLHSLVETVKILCRQLIKTG